MTKDDSNVADSIVPSHAYSSCTGSTPMEKNPIQKQMQIKGPNPFSTTIVIVSQHVRNLQQELTLEDQHDICNDYHWREKLDEHEMFTLLSNKVSHL